MNDGRMIENSSDLMDSGAGEWLWSVDSDGRLWWGFMGWWWEAGGW